MPLSQQLINIVFARATAAWHVRRFQQFEIQPKNHAPRCPTRQCTLSHPVSPHRLALHDPERIPVHYCSLAQKNPLLTFNALRLTIYWKKEQRSQGDNRLIRSTWGKDKNTIVTAYKAIGKPILNYAAPVWTAQVSQTNWNILQVTQNAALRIATGCHLMASADHIHTETNVIRVKNHNELLTKHVILASHKHPPQQTHTVS